MKLYNNNNKNLVVSLREAVLQGLSPDGGLFMPTQIPKLPEDIVKHLHELFADIALAIAGTLLG